MSSKIYPQQLQQLFDETIKSLGDGDFFKCVANYGKTIIEDAKIVEITNELYKDYEEDLDRLKQVYDPFLTEWKQLAPDLIKIAESCGVKDDPENITRQEQYWLKQTIQEKINYFNKPGHYYDEYRYLVNKIIENGHRSLLIPNHLNKEDQIVLFGSYQSIQTFFEQFELSKEKSFWWAHYQIIRLASGAFGLGIKDQLFHEESSVDSIYLYEFNKIISGSHEFLGILNRKEYDEWLTRLHNFIYPRLLESFTPDNKRIVISLDEYQQLKGSHRDDVIDKSTVSSTKKDSEARIINDAITPEIPFKIVLECIKADKVTIKRLGLLKSGKWLQAKELASIRTSKKNPKNPYNSLTVWKSHTNTKLAPYNLEIKIDDRPGKKELTLYYLTSLNGVGNSV